MRDAGDVIPLLLAGGGGTRLWPASLLDRPKHLLELPPGSGRSLLAHACERARELGARVFAVTTAAQRDSVRAAIPDATVLVEPRGRNTGPCVALSLILIERQLAALVQAANANQAQIDERLRRAEAELAEVHAELRELIAQRRSRGAQVTQPPEEKQAPVQPSAEPALTSVTEETPSTAPTAKPAAAPASTIDTSTTEPTADATAANTATSSSPEPARLDGTPIALPTGATEEEVVQVVGMIGAVSEQLAAQNQKNLERVDTVQREVIAVKAIVAHLREAEGAPAHG